MTSRSLQKRQLSRTKIALFLECPRCFYADVALGIPRVSGPPFTLNNAVDRLLKTEFDAHRAAGTPHPLFATVALDAVPFTHPDLDQWRHNFTGIRWQDPALGWTLFGAVDDLWKTPTGSLIVADYKATAKAKDLTIADIYPGYRQQLEVYQFLVARQGFEVESRAWLVYANGNGHLPVLNGQLTFRMSLLPIDGNRGWVQDTFRAAVAQLGQKQPPAPGKDCPWCEYAAKRAAAS
jgi:hypothetical protein